MAVHTCSPNRDDSRGGAGNPWVVVPLACAGAALLAMLLGCGGMSGKGGGPGASTAPPAPKGGGVTLENYNKLRSGMSQADVAKILGNPTMTEQPPKGSVGVDNIQVWESGQDHIRVTYGGGKVIMMQAFLKGQLYVGNDNKDPGPGKGSGLSRATLDKLDANLGNPGEQKMTEAEVIALVGGQPQKLGPQTIAGGIRSNQTLKWTQGNSWLKVHFINGRLAGFEQDGSIR